MTPSTLTKRYVLDSVVERVHAALRGATRAADDAEEAADVLREMAEAATAEVLRPDAIHKLHELVATISTLQYQQVQEPLARSYVHLARGQVRDLAQALGVEY